MIEDLISVLVCTYNPDIQKLKQTLYSIIIQKHVNFEIIITDDGSNNNCFDEIKNFFLLYNFSNYKLVDNKLNKGTVQNILSGMNFVSGKYVKPISPGDFLYDENTLHNTYEFIKNNPADIYFGTAIYYIRNESQVIINDRLKNPCNLIPYTKKNYKYIKFNYFYNHDYILGASIVYSSDVFMDYLKQISPFVKYAEDFSVICMLADNKKIEYIMNNKKDNFNIIWYEANTGISTNGADKWHKILVEENNHIFDNLLNNNKISKNIIKVTNSANKISRMVKILFLFPNEFICRVILKFTTSLGYNANYYNFDILQKILEKK